MNKENNLPVIRFAGFTEAWEQRKLGEVADFAKGTGYSKNDLCEKGTPIILYGRLYTKYQTTINEVDTFVVAKNGSVYSTGNEVIVPASGETAEDIARASAVVKSGFLLGGDLNIVYPNEIISSIFLALTISNGEQQKELAKKAQGKSVVHLHNSDLKGVKICYPTKEEQQQIGSYFRNLDNLITLHQRKCDSLQKMKKSMLQKMFPKNGESVPEIRFKGFTDAWEQRKLGEMGTTYTGLSGKTKEDFGHGNANFVTYMNVFSNPIASLDMLEPVEIDSRQNEVKVGDVFFTTSSETPEEVGMTSVMLENKPNTYLNSFCFGYRPTEKIDYLYLAYMLRSDAVRKKITFLAQGISRYNISKNRVMEIDIPLPKLCEQTQIGTYFHNLDNLITLHQRKLETLKKLKKSMLQKMFV